MVQLLLSSAVGLVTDFFKHKAEEKKAVHESKLKSIEANSQWDASMASASSKSWKDEWFAIVLSIPMIGAFIPPLVPYIQEGFVVLDTMPEYYKLFLGGAIAASFGIKTLSQWGTK